ncbi:MAG: hypothetical protein BroJett011_59390 [Chloroflexota bacterium]|nr:MAG: hypothetical protein BroJett011_59390 [Chloroflexota bacterium]
MRGHTHALVGVTTVVAINIATPFIQPHVIEGIPSGLVLCFSAAILGALAPDIDAEDSTIENSLGTAGSVASVGLRLFGVQHRGLTHYGIVAVLVTVVAWLFAAKIGYGDVGLAFGLGYLSHVIIADAMTKHGVPLLWPLPGQFHLLPGPFRIKTGSLVETLIFIGVTVLLVNLLPVAVPAEWLRLLPRGLRF